MNNNHTLEARWNLTRIVERAKRVLQGREKYPEIPSTNTLVYLHKRFRVTEAIVFEDDTVNELRIVVRGTIWYNLLDWLYNLLPLDYRGRHRGWMKQAKSIYREIRHIIDDSEKTVVHLIGMSQGAAVCQIIADKLSEHLPDEFIIRTTAFGSPHPFKRGYVPHQRFLNDAVSVYAHRDIVPRVPPKAVFRFEDKVGRQIIGNRRPWFPFVGLWAHGPIVMLASAKLADLQELDL